jgi:hypothetical protein
MGRTIRNEPVNKFKDNRKANRVSKSLEIDFSEDENDELENDELFHVKKRNIKKINKWKRQKINSADSY